MAVILGTAVTVRMSSRIARDEIVALMTRRDGDLDAGPPGATSPARGTDVDVLGQLVGGPVRAVRPLAPDERALLRLVFGIDDPGRLYLPADESAPVLRYVALPAACPVAQQPAQQPAQQAAQQTAQAAGQVAAGNGDGRSSAPACHPVAVRVGLAAPRQPGETWDAFVARVARGGPHAWPGGAQAYYSSLASLVPTARRRFARLVADACAAGFHVRVAETYRSPERQALLLSRGDGRTATATSVHSYGRAVDLVIGDGLVQRPTTAREWIAFRRWVVRYRGGAFRVVGTPERTWDWPHVELTDPVLGFRSVDTLLAAARACRQAAGNGAEAAARCTLTPYEPSPPLRAGAPGATSPAAHPGQRVTPLAPLAPLALACSPARTRGRPAGISAGQSTGRHARPATHPDGAPGRGAGSTRVQDGDAHRGSWRTRSVVP